MGYNTLWSVMYTIVHQLYCIIQQILLVSELDLVVDWIKLKPQTPKNTTARLVWPIRATNGSVHRELLWLPAEKKFTFSTVTLFSNSVHSTEKKKSFMMPVISDITAPHYYIKIIINPHWNNTKNASWNSWSMQCWSWIHPRLARWWWPLTLGIIESNSETTLSEPAWLSRGRQSQK